MIAVSADQLFNQLLQSNVDNEITKTLFIILCILNFPSCVNTSLWQFSLGNLPCRSRVIEQSRYMNE